MRPIARQSTRLASASRARRSSRPRNRCSPPQRPFSTSFQRCSDPRTPANGGAEHDGSVKDRREAVASPNRDSRRSEQPLGKEDADEKHARAAEVEEAEDKPAVETRRSSVRWNARRKRVNDVPKPPPIPKWFLDQNVRLVEHSEASSRRFGVSCRAVQCVDNETGHVLFTIPFYNDLRNGEIRGVLRDWALDNYDRLECELHNLSHRERHVKKRDPAAQHTDGTSRKDEATAAIEESSRDHLKRMMKKIMHEFRNLKRDIAQEDLDFTAQKTDDPDRREKPDEPIEGSPSDNLKPSTATDSPAQVEHAMHANQDRVLVGELRLKRLAWPADPMDLCFLEAEASLRSALSLASNDRQTSSFASDRVDISLQCPDPNSHDQLDEFVHDLAGALHADVIRLDANDFAELTEEYVGQGDDSPGSFSNLGYDVFDGLTATQLRVSSLPKRQTSSEEANEMDEEEDDDEDGAADSRAPPKNILAFLGGLEIKPHDFLLRTGDPLRLGNAAMGGEARSVEPTRDDARLDALLDGLLDAASSKRSLTDNMVGAHDNSRETTPAEATGTTWPRFCHMHPVLWRWIASWLVAAHVRTMTSKAVNEDGKVPYNLVFEGKSGDDSSVATQNKGRNVVIHVRDLRDICSSSLGDSIIRRLVKVVRKRRKAGGRMVIIGTTAQDVPGPVKLPGDRSDDFPFRAFTLPPLFQPSSSHPQALFMEKALRFPQEALDKPGYRRILEINLRHIQAMLRRFDAGPEVELTSRAAYAQLNMRGTHFLTERVLSLDDVQRLSLVALGLSQSYAGASKLSPIHISLAASIMARNDHILRSWQSSKASKDEADIKSRTANVKNEGGPVNDAGKERIEELKKSCNPHETRLLSGVVDPSNVKTRFTDVHAPSETIDALKTLTSLSLLRPDAFKYGVLANDRLPGLLLYGPPGTGKTLLAKAVAKDAKATVLEVTGAQIYEKYVGEGEKMVRAIFSLAKKLSPCVVFIDEADSIFGSRGNNSSRNTHREIINQFLREWDGMDDHSVFMMVATNRPSDLDDAVLRRLPRRLLVDLPVARDRESILGIHLKDENLDSSVSLSKLAEQTPLYSGSDLKNLSVAAALACVREENELSELRKGESEFKLPEKRTLTSKHFDMALAEISASISENMSSLAAIRKFDEQYGDRKGRRKTTGYGFGVIDGLVDESAARVRQPSSWPP